MKEKNKRKVLKEFKEWYLTEFGHFIADIEIDNFIDSEDKNKTCAGCCEEKESITPPELFEGVSKLLDQITILQKEKNKSIVLQFSSGGEIVESLTERRLKAHIGELSKENKSLKVELEIKEKALKEARDTIDDVIAAL